MADKPEAKVSEWIINCPRLTSREEIAEKVFQLEAQLARIDKRIIEDVLFETSLRVAAEKQNKALQQQVEIFERETLGRFGSRKLIALFVLQDELRDLLPELGICSGLSLAIGIIRDALEGGDDAN